MIIVNGTICSILIAVEAVIETYDIYSVFIVRAFMKESVLCTRESIRWQIVFQILIIVLSLDYIMCKFNKLSRPVLLIKLEGEKDYL